MTIAMFRGHSCVWNIFLFYLEVPMQTVVKVMSMLMRKYLEA